MISPEEFESRSENHKLMVPRFLDLHNQLASAMTKPQPVEFFFYSESKENAESLADDLVKLDYEVYGVDRSPDERWSVIGLSAPLLLSNPEFEEWVSLMNELGFINDCEFDGWGTLVDPDEL